MLQREALEILKTGSNVFLTGVPGAGKTYVINQYVKWLEDKGIYPAITASTGIAATHVGGQTIHSFSGIGIEKELNEYKIDQIMEREKLVKKVQNTKVLIIDEVSMLDAQTLNNVNLVLKNIKDPTKPFGGIQVVFVGDFFQLPPVVRKGEYSNYCFASLAWKEARPLTCYLEEQFRQTDETFTNLLLAIRGNSIDEMHIELLDNLKRKTHKKLGIKEEKKVQDGEWEEESVELAEEALPPLTPPYKGGEQESVEVQLDILELHSHNKNVDEINERKLNLIKGKEFVHKMLTQGRASLVENLIKTCLSPEVLKLKIGAKVIFTKNDLEGKFVNGTLGVVVDLDKDKIIVETKEGKVLDVKQEEWKIEDDGKVKARINQYPLRLAWAITVHKSQGMSLDEAIISLGETFEYGQGYVALSRVRSLEGLYLKSYNPKSLQVNEAISEFDEKIRKDSRFIQNKFLNAVVGKLEELQKEFVKKGGGIWEGGIQKKEKENKKPSAEITLELLQSGKNIEEIAEERDIKWESVFKHLEELYKLKKIQKLDLEKIAPQEINVFSVPNDVKKSFRKFKSFKDEEGNIKLTPVFKDLKEEYTYETLRWYRLVM